MGAAERASCTTNIASPPAASSASGQPVAAGRASASTNAVSQNMSSAAPAPSKPCAWGCRCASGTRASSASAASAIGTRTAYTARQPNASISMPPAAGESARTSASTAE